MHIVLPSSNLKSNARGILKSQQRNENEIQNNLLIQSKAGEEK